MNPDWTNARSADGPTIAAYVAEQYPALRTEMHKEDPFCITVTSWDRADRLVDFYSVDRWLVPRGFMLCDLPAECWRWSRAKTPIKLRPLCEELVGQYAEGRQPDAALFIRTAYKHYGLQYRVARRWIDGIEVAA